MKSGALHLQCSFFVERKPKKMDVKQELANKVAKTAKAEKREVTLTKGMSIADLIRAMEPEIKKALPSVITPERFTRMALSAINNTPKLAECSQMSFLAALMTSALPEGSSIAVGSSMIMHLGCMAMTPAIDTRCF